MGADLSYTAECYSIGCIIGHCTILDDEKNFTKQWINVTEAVKAGKIKNVEQIKSVYNISPIVEETLNELLNQKK